MIRFFRHLRQRLLAENRVARYLFYAVGEVILVMVGILLAFQVNEWKDGRDKRHKEKQTLELLIRDLQEDRKNLVVFEHFLERQEAGVIGLLEGIGEGAPPDSLLNAARDGLGIWNYRPTYPTYEGLRQSGSLDLISDSDIRNQIIWFHDEVIPYLDDLREGYKQDDLKAQEAFEPYLGFRYEAGWQLYTSFETETLRRDSRAINAVSRSGRKCRNMIKRLHEVFYPENQKLTDSLAHYLNQIQ